MAVSDKELIRIASKFRDGLLGRQRSDLKCFMVCAPLQGFLKACGIDTELIEGDIEFDEGTCNHVWLQLSDGRILDPTIDQFRMFMGERLPKVYLGQPMPMLHVPRPTAS